MDEKARVAALPWFAGLGSPVREALIAGGRISRRAAGEWLYGEGDPDTGLVAVLGGGLHLQCQAPGGSSVLVNLLPVGGVIGQSVVFGGGPRLITAICAVPSTLFSVPDATLRRTAAQHPELWPSFTALIYGQLRGVIQGYAECIALKPRDRLVSRLLAWSAFDPHIPASQSALAEMVGASRVAVNGWLAELEGAGLVERGYGQIRVLNRAGLERLAAD